MTPGTPATLASPALNAHAQSAPLPCVPPPPQPPSVHLTAAPLPPHRNTREPRGLYDDDDVDDDDDEQMAGIVWRGGYTK